MSQSPSTEERLATLEAEVAQIKDQLQLGAEPWNWLDRVVGSMTRYPDFREVLRLGREFREADRPLDNEWTRTIWASSKIEFSPSASDGWIEFPGFRRPPSTCRL